MLNLYECTEQRLPRTNKCTNPCIKTANRDSHYLVRRSRSLTLHRWTDFTFLCGVDIFHLHLHCFQFRVFSNFLLHFFQVIIPCCEFCLPMCKCTYFAEFATSLCPSWFREKKKERTKVDCGQSKYRAVNPVISSETQGQFSRNVPRDVVKI